MLDYTSIIINCILIVIYIITFFVFLEVKTRARDDFSKTFLFFTLALAVLIITEIIVLLNNAYITNVPYLVEALLIVYALVFFCAAYCMLRSIRRVSDHKRR